LKLVSSLLVYIFPSAAFDCVNQEVILELLQADERFFWNQPLLTPLIRQQMHEWILPVIYGFLEIATVTLQAGFFEASCFVYLFSAMYILTLVCPFFCELKYQQQKKKLQPEVDANRIPVSVYLIPSKFPQV
jgi:hypothetical protein